MYERIKQKIFQLAPFQQLIWNKWLSNPKKKKSQKLTLQKMQCLLDQRLKQRVFCNEKYFKGYVLK